MTRRLATLICAVALSLTGCVANGDEITVYAEFDDALDLVERASVRAGDVIIGTITAITLTDDERALVAMTIDADVMLPAQMAAWLSKTSLLGERFVDLRPLGTSGRLSDGATISETRIITDLEDLVGTGSEVLALVAADQLQLAVQAGAEALGGRGSLIGQVLDNVRAVVGRYEDGTDTLTTLIDELTLLTASLAPDAAANAEDLVLLREVAEALDAQDEQLLDSLADLQRLSTVGERILEEHDDDLDNGIRRLRILLAEVNRVDGALDDLLFYLPYHNRNTPDGAINELAQVWTDFVVCGSQDTEGDPAGDCTPANAGSAAAPPGVNPCPQSQVRCPWEVER
jgi:phospholipid/cholesterol/gamma-HCH transport system substrate-binding protein